MLDGISDPSFGIISIFGIEEHRHLKWIDEDGFGIISIFGIEELARL